jgi:hypothetical protein
MSINNTKQDLQDSELDLQAKQIAGLLDAHANRLNMRTLKKLEDGRERAVKVHAQQISGAGMNHDGTLNSIYSWAEHHRIVSASLVLGAIIAGFVIMQSFNHKEPSDAILLSADLPPEAFVDRSFEPTLNNRHAKF